MRYNGDGQKTNYRFTGQRWDQGHGLYWFNSRWFDPLVGRFMQADTIVPEPGNPQALNRYSYVLGNPLRYTDPTGHAFDEGNLGGDVEGWVALYNVRIIRTASGYYIDTAHYLTARATTQKISAGIDRGQPFPVVRNSTASVGPVTVQVGVRMTYLAQPGLSPDQQTGVALGILMDSSIAFEGFQALPPSSHSSYSGEDLSSDYLGFYAQTTGKSLDELLDELGPWQEGSKPGSMPKNYAFSPLVQDNNGQWANVAWPAPLSITPIGSESGLWQRMSAEPVAQAKVGSFLQTGWLGPSDVTRSWPHGWTIVP